MQRGHSCWLAVDLATARGRLTVHESPTGPRPARPRGMRDSRFQFRYLTARWSRDGRCLSPQHLSVSNGYHDDRNRLSISILQLISYRSGNYRIYPNMLLSRKPYYETNPPQIRPRPPHAPIQPALDAKQIVAVRNRGWTRDFWKDEGWLATG